MSILICYEKPLKYSINTKVLEVDMVYIDDCFILFGTQICFLFLIRVMIIGSKWSKVDQQDLWYRAFE